jgi:hypothetical protein
LGIEAIRGWFGSRRLSKLKLSFYLTQQYKICLTKPPVGEEISLKDNQVLILACNYIKVTKEKKIFIQSHLHTYWFKDFTWLHVSTLGPGSSVGIATGYGLDGSGIELGASVV